MKRILKIIIITFFIPITILIKIISPIIRIRWCKNYFPDRIGHIVAEMEQYLYLTKDKSKFIIDVFPNKTFDNSNPSNIFLHKHYAKKIFLINEKVIFFLQKSQDILEKYFRFLKFENIDYLFSTRDNFKIFKKNFSPSISFSRQEIKTIKETLNKIGLKKKQKFICLIVRDGKYLKKKLANMDTSYHSYRDSNVQEFMPSIKYLLKKNYFILRMGKLQSKKLNLKHKNFSDYAFSKFRSDLMDVWLMANCEFCISTGTGLDQISRVFNKPILFVNHLPLTDWSSHFRSITHPKILFDKKKKIFLSIEDYIKHSYFRSSQYRKKNIKIIDLNKNKILMCVKEFLKVKKNNWEISTKEKKLQTTFKTKFKKYLAKYHSNIDFHENMHKHAFLSFNFLKQKKKI